MFAKLLLKKNEFDFVTMHHFSLEPQIFEAKIFLEIQKQSFKTLVIKSTGNKVVSCLPRRVLPNTHLFLFV